MIAFPRDKIAPGLLGVHYGEGRRALFSGCEITRGSRGPEAGLGEELDTKSQSNGNFLVGADPGVRPNAGAHAGAPGQFRAF